jgi:hypothetical protein
MNARHRCRLIILTASIVAANGAYANPPAATSAVSDAPKPEIIGDPVEMTRGGILFHCSRAEVERLQIAMSAFLKTFHWQVGRQILLEQSPDGKSLAYRLNGTQYDSDTLALSRRADLDVGTDTFTFTRCNHKTDEEETLTLPLVSPKEIVAALLSPGRLTELKGGHGSVDKLKDHIGIRQNTARWAQRACWEYAAQADVVYDPQKWQVGKDGWALKPGVLAHEAVADAFVSALQYKMGCQRACRFIMVQGIMDYYAHVKGDGVMLSRLNGLAAGRPINDIAAEVDESGSTLKRGKYLDRQSNVPWNNWVPGDWGYIRNPNEESRTTISGYEGSNIVYIGRGLFGVYYGGPKTRTLDRSLLRVFRWRYEAKNAPQKEAETPELLEVLRKTPSQGGLLLDHRYVPQLFELSDLEGTADNE